MLELSSDLRFENDVNMYGTQTEGESGMWNGMFENDVNMYGTQTGNGIEKDLV